MRSKISDSQLIEATAKVRNAMLLDLDGNEIPAYQFSEEFKAKISTLKQIHRKNQHLRRLVRTCAAAVMTILIGLSLFLTFNTEARAAVISWIKEVLADRTVYYFTQEESSPLPEYELTWIPGSMECVYDETTEISRSIVYMNPADPTEGFTLSYGIMQDGSALMLITNETEHTITDITINGCIGELYLSHDSDVAHCLIWFDEEKQVTFNITWLMDDTNMILKIAEGIQLQN